MSLIIGLSGKSKSGKTTAANFLTANFNVIRRGFADGLRSVVANLFSLDATTLQDYKDQPLPRLQRTPRDILIEVGKHMREVDPDVWFKLWERDLAAVTDQFPMINVVVDDLRFRNEFDLLRAKGAVLIRINRGVHAVTDEPSEIDLDEYASAGKFDYTINNMGSVREFYTGISDVVSHLLVQQYIASLPKNTTRLVSVS